MKIQLPIEFENRMRSMLGDEFSEFLSAYEESNYHGLRINELKAGVSTADELKALFGIRPVPWCMTGYYYDEDVRPGRHPYHHAGLYYIQEPSAMFVGELAREVIRERRQLTDSRMSMRVLDLCAAPGGKTGHIAGVMNGDGVLVANEIVPGRAKILSQNVERMGISNCIVTNENPDRLATFMPGYFDLIVVDAPCSGEGMFRRDEIARTEWSEANVEMCAKRGQDILDAADKMLKYGGVLIYSTCTFAPAEDEQAISDFLSGHPEYYVKKVKVQRHDGSNDLDGWPSAGRMAWVDSEGESVDKDERKTTDRACADSSADADRDVEAKFADEGNITDTYRLWPHRLHGEGHYAAVIRKGNAEAEYITATDDNQRKKERMSKKSSNQKTGNLSQAIKLFEAFAEKFLCEIPEGEYRLFGDNLYLMPQDSPLIDSLRLERAGLWLGEVKKDRFEPSHALALSLREGQWRMAHNICDEQEMVKYLRGESIPCGKEVNGWCVVTFAGYSAGLGKASNGMIKNHYPKGLRIMM